METYCAMAHLCFTVFFFFLEWQLNEASVCSSRCITTMHYSIINALFIQSQTSLKYITSLFHCKQFSLCSRGWFCHVKPLKWILFPYTKSACDGVIPFGWVVHLVWVDGAWWKLSSHPFKNMRTSLYFCLPLCCGRQAAVLLLHALSIELILIGVNWDKAEIS